MQLLPFIRKLYRPLLALVAVFAVLAAASIGLVYAQTSGQRHSSVASTPSHRVAIVFGAYVNASGRPSEFLRLRLDGAVALYRAGKVEKLLMSGDNSRTDYDEVTNMKNYALEQGVPESAIALDYAGRSTYDSCYRARHIFGLTDAILVTNSYHLPRAVYSCMKLGMQVDGLGVQDFSLYPRLFLPYMVREVLADMKAILQVNITRPTAEVMGQQEVL